MTGPEIKKFFSLTAAVAVAFSVSSCSWIRDVTGEERPLGLSPTGLGAASGAVVGAGVGAIIGSQSGNAGPGVAIGSLAGAALGGALGQQEEREKNSNEERNSRTDRHDELLKANERRINEYKKGVDISAERRGALSNPNFASKKVSSNSSNSSLIVNAPSGYRGSPRAVRFSDVDTSSQSIRPVVNAAIEPRIVASRTTTTKLKGSIPTENKTTSKVISKTNQLDLIQEIEPVKPTVVQPVAKLEQRGLPQAKAPEPVLIQKEADETIKSEITKATSAGGIVGIPVDQNQISTEEIKTTVITGSKVGKSGQDDDCSRADQEYQRASTSISDADKLFYLRRALRLCSSKPNLHLATGKIYAKLGRIEDAEYEFRQVLDLESNNAEATKELSSLKQGAR